MIVASTVSVPAARKEATMALHVEVLGSIPNLAIPFSWFLTVLYSLIFRIGVITLE